tara:strand:- start:819 stop:1592 length:774 start_codon:yes stop_codon:yes gene_type:complete
MIYATNNLKLSRIIEKKHWNNIFDKLNDNIYYTKCHKWKFYNNKLLLQRKYSKIDSYVYKNNVINISNTIYNIDNNTKIYLIDNCIKMYVNKNIKNNINICIYHPYNQECMFNINIRYDNATNKLDNIFYNTKSIENTNFYWEDNYKVKITNTLKNIDTDFLFGSNINLTYPLKLTKYLNNEYIYNKKFPYLYERTLLDNYYLIELPHNIKLKIPINNTIKHYNLEWNFKNELKKNIVNLYYLENSTLNYINYFMYN